MSPRWSSCPCRRRRTTPTTSTRPAPAGDNYWGYSTLDYFAPDRRYSSDRSAGGPTREFKAMVKAYHDAGIKVLIDVVYNHTAEGGPWNSADKTTYSLLSMRGLDNPTYYELTIRPAESVRQHRRGRQLQHLQPRRAADRSSTRSATGRTPSASTVSGSTWRRCSATPASPAASTTARPIPATALNRITATMPARPAQGGTGTDWIAEPWAIGSGTYQLGNFPAGWSEWNGDFRDTLRADQNDLGTVNVTPGQLANEVRWFVRPVPGRRPRPLELCELHGRPRRLHLGRPLRLQQQEQQPGLAVRTVRRRLRRQPLLGPGRRPPPPSARPPATASPS